MTQNPTLRCPVMTTTAGAPVVDNQNSLTAAAQTRFLNPNNGAELFRAGIGQKFYFKKRQRIAGRQRRPL